MHVGCTAAKEGVKAALERVDFAPGTGSIVAHTTHVRVGERRIDDKLALSIRPCNTRRIVNEKPVETCYI